jgi:hypothetical protein
MESLFQPSQRSLYEHQEKAVKAEESLRKELQAYESKKLQELLTTAEKQDLDLSTKDKLVEEAIAKITAIQAISREEIWDNPPHILVTNYSMLEHMLIRPKERQDVFAASKDSFKMLVVEIFEISHHSVNRFLERGR